MNKPVSVAVRYLFMRLLSSCLLCMAIFSIAMLAQGQEGAVSVLPSTVSPTETDVQVTASIEPSDDLVVSQQVVLNIEVVSPIWFSGGTRIGSFEIDDVVILRREKFSVNSVRRVGDQTWSVQLWSMTLYPQTAGQFVIPEIELDISIAKEGGQATTVSRRTKPIAFAVRLPDDVQQQITLSNTHESTWVATTRFDVEESYDRGLTDLKIGDSVKRTVDIRSENIAAMMLPALRFVAPDGLAVYQNTPKITDRVNRGDYIASRQETVSYVVEKAGAYRLPALDFYWWDLNTQSLRQMTLPEQVISTSGAAGEIAVEFAAVETNKIVAPNKHSYLGIIKYLMLFGAVLMVLILCWFKRNTHWSHVLKDRKREAELEQRFIDQCRRGEFSQASCSFYLWFKAKLDPAQLSSNDFSVRRWIGARKTPRVLKLFDDLMAAAHSEASVEQGNESQAFESLLIEMKSLMAAEKRSDQSKGVVEFGLN